MSHRDDDYYEASTSSPERPGIEEYINMPLKTSKPQTKLRRFRPIDTGPDLKLISVLSPVMIEESEMDPNAEDEINREEEEEDEGEDFGTEERREKVEGETFPSEILKKPMANNRTQLLRKVYDTIDLRIRWQREIPQKMHNIPEQRPIHSNYMKYIKIKNKVGEQIAANLKQVDRIAKKLEYAENILKTDYSHKLDRRKQQLFEKLKDSWKEMNVEVTDTVRMFEFAVDKFMNKEDKRASLFSLLELNDFQTQFRKLDKYVEHDRKTLNVIEENMESLFEVKPKPKISASRFKIKRLFPLAVRDQRKARKRVKKFQTTIEEQVMRLPERYEEDQASNEYSAFYQHTPVYGTQRQSRFNEFIQ